MIVAYSFVVVLAFQEATQGPVCALEDHRCKASLYLQRARKAATPKERASHLFAAHRTFLALFDQAGKAVDFCAARRAFEQSIKVAGQPDSQRASFAALGDELTKRERRGEIRCGPSRVVKPASAPAPAPATVAGSARTRAPSADVVSPASERAAAQVPSPAALLLEPRATPATSQDDLMPVVATYRAPAMPRSAMAPRSGQGLVIAGAATLGVGLALTGAAGYMGGRLLSVWRESRELHGEAGPLGTEDQAAKDLALAHEYQRLRGPTLALAIVGAGTVILGAVLVGVGAKRLSRVASRTALLPMPGGLVFRARF